MIANIHGLHEPFTVVRQAMKRGRRDLEIPDEGEVVATLENQFSVMVGMFWLISAGGRGRSPIFTDASGTVTPRIIKVPLHEGAFEAKKSNLNPTELDFSDTVIALISQGMVRVDHLRDEKGEPLGLPSQSVYESREYFTWCQGVLNQARLKQLHQELQDSEEGRGLSANFKPKMGGSVERRLLSKAGKEVAHRDEDRKILKQMKAKLEDVAKAVNLVVKSADKAEAPGGKE